MRALPMLVAGAVLASATAAASAAANAGLSYTDTAWFNDGPFVVGYDFTPNTAVTVTHLGFYDERGTSGVGLPTDETYPVAIYDTDTGLVVAGATATVTNASPLVLGDVPDGFFVYEPLAQQVS